MKPIGKTYLIEAIKEGESIENGIIIPDSTSNDDIFYKGIIKAYGTGWTDEEIKNLVPIESKVLLKYGDKKGIKLIIKNNVYYIHEEDHVIAVVED